MIRVLVTGGAGYIGTHAVLRLLRDGHDVTVIDNLSRGHTKPLDLIRNATNVSDARLSFTQCDITDRACVERVLCDRKIEVVMHFAALAYVRESVEKPLEYYHANVTGSLALIQACEAAGVDRFILSSTCATYGEAPPSEIPIRETTPQSPINPYGWSKLFVERMLTDWHTRRAREGRPISIAFLRYFNVAGCDQSGILGEDHEPETHVIPLLLQTALGKRERFTILGTDYPTPDGTCVRDYIHVDDLVDAHVKVMTSIKPGDARAYNLGIGQPYSVREIVESVRRVTRKNVNVVEAARALGDPPTLYADASKISRELGWRPSVTKLDDIVKSAWTWFERHPNGYR